MDTASGVVPLFQLTIFHADFFIENLSQLNALERLALQEDPATLAKPEMAAHMFAKVSMLQAHAEMYGFSSISAQCQRIMRTFTAKGPTLTCGEIRDDLRALRQRCEDEFKNELFLHLDQRAAAKYGNPTKDWDEVVARFSQTRHNIEESSKCFALERYGAAVFHILLVAEYGVILIAKLMGVAGDKPGWGQLQRLEKILKKPYPERDTLEQEHTKLLEAVVPLAIVVKDSWRHKLTHVENQIVWNDTDFSPQVAEEIINATRGFMRKLATELPR